LESFPFGVNQSVNKTKTYCGIQIQEKPVTPYAQRIVEHLHRMVHKSQIVPSSHFFRSSDERDRIIAKLSEARPDRSCPGIRILSVHPEQDTIPTYPRGHVSFIHDCNKNRGSCRCEWIRESGPVRFAKGNLWSYQWSTHSVYQELVYLSTSRHYLTCRLVSY
jgi:hypothetical protein